MAVHSDRDSKIRFDKLKAVLEDRGKTWQFLRADGISPGILSKMKEGKGDISTKTIERVCELLNCQPGDFMEYIPDEPEE